MRVFTILASVASVALISACTNLDDASTSTRNTFIRTYEGPLSLTATDILITDEGYLLLGNMTAEDESLVTVVIRTDRSGNQLDTTFYHRGGFGKSIKPFTNSSFSGYLILGDRIQVDPNAAEVGNIEITSSWLLGLNQDLTMKGSATFGDTVTVDRSTPVFTDFSGKCLTLTSDGRVILMNSYKPDGETERPYLVSLKKDFTFSADPYANLKEEDVDWYNPFSSIIKDNIVGKSIHYKGSEVFWATTILEHQGTFDNSYVSVLRVPYGQGSSNGQTLEYSSFKSFVLNDIQPSKSTDFGVVGTFGEIDGSKKNMFFTRASAQGTLQAKDTLFFDAKLIKTGSTTSVVEDTGETLTPTGDSGFVLAGTMLTASIDGKTFGNGARDIFLVKLSYNNEIMWTKTLGGIGDEVVSRIKTTSDGGLLIYGTNTLGGYSSLFLIKTDKNGELKN